MSSKSPAEKAAKHEARQLREAIAARIAMVTGQHPEVTTLEPAMIEAAQTAVTQAASRESDRLADLADDLRDVAFLSQPQLLASAADFWGLDDLWEMIFADAVRALQARRRRGEMWSEA